jgi:hypothetical protein
MFKAGPNAWTNSPGEIFNIRLHSHALIESKITENNRYDHNMIITPCLEAQKRMGTEKMVRANVNLVKIPGDPNALKTVPLRNAKLPMRTDSTNILTIGVITHHFGPITTFTKEGLNMKTAQQEGIVITDNFLSAPR